MSCLDDLVILRGFCSDATSISGLAVNDLPGIHIKQVASLANEEQKNFSGVWDNVYKRATSIMEGDVLVHFQSFMKTNILIDDETFGYYRNDYETEGSSANYKGVAIKLFGSKYLKVFINKVFLRLENNSASSSTITIFDYNDGRTLDTVSFTPQDGLNEIPINKSYDMHGQKSRIFVAYDGAIADAMKSSSVSQYDYSRFAVIRGAKVSKASAVTKDNMDFDGETHGMVLDLTVNCSIENVLCSNKYLFRIPLWYKLGAELMNERLNSDRINAYTMLNKEQAKERRDMYDEKYEKQLNSILSNMEPTGDNLCFSCNKKRQYLYSKP